MERRKFSREFKLELVKQVRDRMVSVAQTARDLDVHTNVLQKWVGEAVSDPGSEFPRHGTMMPEQHEIERLRRELARMKAERDILKKRRPTSRRTRYEVRLRREAPGDLACIVDMRGPRGLAQRLSGLAVRAPSARSRSDAELANKVRTSFIFSYQTYGARRVWHDLLAEACHVVFTV